MTLFSNRLKEQKEKMEALIKENTSLKAQLNGMTSAVVSDGSLDIEILKLKKELAIQGEQLKQAIETKEKLATEFAAEKEKWQKEFKSAVTEASVAIVAAQGIPMIKLDPEKDPGSITSDISKDRQAIFELYRSRSQQNNIDMANRFNNNNNNQNRK